MDWVKLATDYYTDERVEQLETDAELMFVRGLARAGELERGGFIPESSLARLARRRRYATLVSALVASGLWTKVAGGYRITGWSDWQGELDALAARRTADRERQRKRRLRQRDQAESTTSRDNGHVSRDVTLPEEEEELEEVQLGGKAYGPSINGHAPPRRCKKHLNDEDPPPCGGCRDARLAADERLKAQAIASAQRHLAEAKQRSATTRCSRCGIRHTGPCAA